MYVHRPSSSAFPIWPAIGLFAALDVVGLAWTGIGLDRRGLLFEFAAVALLAGVGAIYRYTGRSDAIARTADSGAQLVAVGLVLEVLSYLVTTLGRPLVDGALLRADAALGFDWAAWTGAVHASPVVARLLVYSYNALLPETAFAVLFLALWRSADGLLRAMIVAGVVTVLVPAVVPAVGHLPAAPHVHDFVRLRSGDLHTIDLTRLEGLIAFPSFHAALAVLLAYALRDVPWVRAPVLVLNTVMLVATVSEGGHYLVDVLAGVAVAVFAALVVSPVRPAAVAPLPGARLTPAAARDGRL